ncbi:MAG TPA: IS110 family transposase [Jiangellaceae bacterium]|nr:IS110 family transposase [Jiangellaceae bacterium]
MEHQQQYVGIDLHRRRSVVVRVAEDGQVLGVDQVVNDPVELSMAVAKAGPDPEVALESTYGWYWAVDLLQAHGAHVHLVHPLGLHWDTRRVKNDIRDSTELANRLRRGDLPESYIAPPAQRELRELVRFRAKLTALRTSAKAQIHAVMAKEGILPCLDDMFGPGGQVRLDQMPCEGAYALRVDSLRKLLEVYAGELTVVEAELAARLADHAGYQAIQAICGVGPIMAAIFAAEIGDVGRFPTARHLCSWAGLTPSHRESDTKIQRGHITKQGNHLVRWAAIEAVARYHGGDPIAPTYTRVARRRGRMIGRVAAARKLLTLVYYGLRDGQIRCLADEAA